MKKIFCDKCEKDITNEKHWVIQAEICNGCYQRKLDREKESQERMK